MEQKKLFFLDSTTLEHGHHVISEIVMIFPAYLPTDVLFRYFQDASFEKEQHRGFSLHGPATHSHALGSVANFP